MTVNQNCRNDAQSLFQVPAGHSIVKRKNGKNEPNWEKKNLRMTQKARVDISSKEKEIKNKTHPKKSNYGSLQLLQLGATTSSKQYK